ncbi:MAG: hypothetical protein IT365_23355 [Candidatus Hydrogenedentes bacterium]|nr:hypothetical protein [Candidatus Hydrogenedentota bacterium]
MPPYELTGDIRYRRLVQGSLIYVLIFALFWTYIELSGRSLMAVIHGLPLALLIPFLIVHSLLSAIIVMELARTVLKGHFEWSRRRHLYAVAVCWALLISGQIPLVVSTHF